MTRQGRAAGGGKSGTVAIVGGGYGGAAVAKALDEHLDVVLIEPKDAFVNAAGALRAVTRPEEWAERIFFPYNGILKNGSHRRDYAAAVDAEGVTLASGERVEADYIVLATGSGYPYPAKPRTDSTAEALAHFKETHAELAGAGRVLIAGAGPVGLELAGEIRDAWPAKRITVVDPGTELVPGYTDELRAELVRQLKELDIEVRLGVRLDSEPEVAPGLAGEVYATAGGEAVEADIWFRAYGASTNSGFLGDLAPLNERGQIRVTATLNVDGHARVYAVGDLTDVPEEKRAGAASRHAEVVAANILAQANGEAPQEEYRPSPIRVMVLPLGPTHGVGQVPSPHGPVLMATEAVADLKGRDLMRGRFAQMFDLP